MTGAEKTAPRDGASQSGPAFTLLAVLIAATGILVVYGGQIAIGLYYDDYHFVRPWSSLDLRHVWLSSWDPSGIESVFFRPLSSSWYALRFWLFGLNATAMHIVSVVGDAVCAVLAGWFLRRERAPAAVALLGAWVYAVHPAFPYAQVSWLTNQMHLNESLIVLAALITWQSVRDRPLIWWTPIVLLAVIGFLIKEDAVMLLPAIVALTIARGWIIGSIDYRRWLILAGGAITIGLALFTFRYEHLGRIGGYGTPTLAMAAGNFERGLQTTLFLWPTRHPWQGVASATAIGAIATGLILMWLQSRREQHEAGSNITKSQGHHITTSLSAGLAVAIGLAFNLPYLFMPRTGDYPLLTWQGVASGLAISALTMGAAAAMWKNNRHALFVIAAGLGIALLFDVPFALVTKREQYHLLGLGAVMVFAGSAQALWHVASRRGLRLTIGIAVVLATIPMGVFARGTASNFLPCGTEVLGHDREAQGWWVVPDEIKSWLTEKAATCAAGRPAPSLLTLPLVSWGFNAEEHDGQAAFRWTSDHAVLLTPSGAPSISLAFRRPDATTGHTIRATILSSGKATTMTLDSPEWQYVTIRFAPSLLSWLRQAQRVDIDAPQWFVPAQMDPKSADLRRLGVEMRIVGDR